MKRSNESLISIVPSERQLQWQKLEFYGFIHFGINTFTDKEWGDGTEDISIFNPSNLDAEQWVISMKQAGMKGLILTAKHHDGLCLWPTSTTEHNVSNTPYQNDIVKEVSIACQKHNLKFGIYLSPWDQNHPTYGQGDAYDAVYLKQLEELLTNYGELFSIWFDGANGEGPNGKKQFYNWNEYYSLIRRLQPQAVISVSGPDVRWCGNEAGYTRNQEWSVVPKVMQDKEKIASESQKSDDKEFAQSIGSSDEDIGSRKALEKYEGDLCWYPAEVNTSIRPGWFYHQDEDDKVKTPQELFHVYINSVGGNATFLLNIPPNKKGLIAKEDVKALKELGEYIAQFDLEHKLKFSEYYEDSSIILTSNRKQKVNAIILQEDIQFSQRVESYVIEAMVDGKWQLLKEGLVIGYKKIDLFDEIKTDQFRVKIMSSRGEPKLIPASLYSIHKF